jgi:N-acetylglutamate synthase-like GNAT family acetyltransferase
MIRLASHTDEKALLNLLTAIDKNDYVVDLLHCWLDEKSVYLYEQKDIVGMVRLTYTPDHQAHLGAIRVHPDKQRQGIGTALTAYCMSICRTHKIRLAVMDNVISETLAQKVGFSQVATFTFLELCVPDTVLFAQYLYGTPAEALSIVTSPVSYQQFLSTSFMFYTPSLENMQGLVVLKNKGIVLLDFNVEEARNTAVQIAYCDCDHDLLKAVLYEAKKRNMEKIWAVVPKTETIILFLKRCGFEPVVWAETINVFECTLV